MYYTIYKITNVINGKYYIGMHQTNDLEDGYFGSGVGLRRAINKHGKHNFKKEIIFIFDKEEDMIQKEKELVTISENSYNMTEGGKGGFSYINIQGINLGANNVMNRDYEAKQRCIDNAKKTRSLTPDLYRNIAKQNLQKAIAKNKGQKRPQHSVFMKEYSKKLWEENKEIMRDKLSSTFLVTSPKGEEYLTNRLEDFCKHNNLTYVSVWNTSRTGTAVKKGKSKGWICKIIAQ
jgi:ribosomal protein L7Ae-like RNA K-turn-binding protein